LPELHNKYPDKLVRLDLQTTSYPQITSTPVAVNMQVTTSLLFSVIISESTVEKAFIVSLDLVGQFVNASIASVQQGAVINVYGSLQHCTSDVKLIQSFIGDVNVTMFGKVLQLLIINGQVAKLNNLLKAGIPIDLHEAVPGLTVDSAKLLVNQGYVVVAGNLNYTPTLPQVEQVDPLLNVVNLMSQKLDQLKERVASLEQKLACDNQ
jgi:hypothetical protein